MEVGVAVVVVEPALPGQCTRRRHAAVGETRIVADAVEHGFVPLVVTLHTAVVVARLAVGAAVDAGGDATAVGDGIGDADQFSVGLFGHAAVVGWHEGEVGRQHVLFQRAVLVAIGIQLVGHHVRHARGDTARVSLLVNNGASIVFRRAVMDSTGQSVARSGRNGRAAKAGFCL